MIFTVRKRNGKTSIRVQIGSLAITVEFPLRGSKLRQTEIRGPQGNTPAL